MPIRHIFKVDVAVGASDGAAELLADLDRAFLLARGQVDLVDIAGQRAGDEHFLAFLLDDGLAVRSAGLLHFFKAHTGDLAFHFGAGFSENDPVLFDIRRGFHRFHIDDR